MARVPDCLSGSCGFKSRQHCLVCSVRIVVSTPDFLSGNEGSIPLRSTNYLKEGKNQKAEVMYKRRKIAVPTIGYILKLISLLSFFL